MLFVSTLLAAAGCEILQNDAHRYTLLAVFAEWPVSKFSAASKALLDKAAIYIGVN